MAIITPVELTNTFETWRTRTNVGFARLNQFAINESSLYANTITANVAFTSKGAVTHQTTMLQTGAAVFGSTIRYGGVTLANTVTGTGNMVLSTAPTITGHPTIEGVTATGATGTGKFVFDGSPIIASPVFSSTIRYGGVTLANTVTGTGSLVLAASPTFTGSVTVAGLKANGVLGSAGYFLRTNGTTAYWDALPALSNYALLSGAVFSGSVVLGTTLRYGGVTLANTVTGTGSLVLATSPSVTTLTVSSGGLSVTAGGATVTAGGVTVANGNIALAGNKLVNYTENATAYTNLTGSVTVPTNSNVVRYTVTGTATLTLPANMPNQSASVKNIIIVLKQNATGTYVVTLAPPSGETIVYNNSATQPANQTGANKVTIYQCMKFDGDTRWYVSMGFYEA